MDPGVGSAFAGPGGSGNAISIKITGADAIAKIMQMLGGGSKMGEIVKGVEDIAQDGKGGKEDAAIGAGITNDGDGVGVELTFEKGEKKKGFFGRLWSKVSSWWKNNELYFEAQGDVSVGIQAGAGVDINDTKLKAEGNLMSVELVSGSYQQTGSDNGPEIKKGNYIGKKGQYVIKQGASIPLVGYEHSFTTTGYGYIPGTEVSDVNVGPAAINTDGAARIKIGAKAALILGIGASVEFGFRPKSKP